MSKNDITGDNITSKMINDNFRENFDRIFKPMRKIYYWPHGVWCDKCDLPYMTHVSDDFGVFEVSYDTSDEAIDRMVNEMVNK